MNCALPRGKLALFSRLAGKSNSELFRLTMQARNNLRGRSGQPWHLGLQKPVSQVMTPPYFPLHLPSEGIRVSCSCTPPDATPFTNHRDVWQSNSETIRGTGGHKLSNRVFAACLLNITLNHSLNFICEGEIMIT